MLLTLVAFSARGSRLLRERGACWRVVDKRMHVQFSIQPGPWLLIVPQGCAPDDDSLRWVHGLFDDRYKVMPGAPDHCGPTSSSRRS